MVKVSAVVDEDTAKVTVLRVIRGGHKVGQVLTASIYDPRGDLGKTLVLSDPDEGGLEGPGYEELDAEFEAEVRFLARGDDAKPRTMDEAIMCIQGISVGSQEKGLEWLAANRKTATPKVIEAIEARKKAVLGASGGTWDVYRVTNLWKALLKRPDAPALKFARKELDARLKDTWPAMDWSGKPDLPDLGSRGEYLSGLLSAIRKQPAAQGWRKSLLSAFPRQHGSALAHLTYALAHSGFMSPAKLGQLMKGKPAEVRDAFAIGLYWAGNTDARVWSWKSAHEAWSVAAEHAADHLLKRAIAEARKRKR